LYHPEESSRKKIRSRSPVQEMYLGLHGMEAAEAAMANLGSFLTATERALFGVALDPTGHPTSASEMVTEFVTELDFGDIDPRLATRLTDEHLKCILDNIDAEHYLEVLKLTHCVGVTGRGLEPLSDSRVLELLDLSLMKLHESPSIALSKSDISEAAVLPILDSILRRGEHSALKHIQFPQKWKRVQAIGSKISCGDTMTFLILTLDNSVSFVTSPPPMDSRVISAWTTFLQRLPPLLYRSRSRHPACTRLLLCELREKLLPQVRRLSAVSR
jgi:hypothetical protein